MPIYMEISRLHRTVMVVARSKVGADDIRVVVRQLVDARVPEFAKIVDVTAATSELGQEQVEKVAASLRGDPNEKRGPVVFIVSPDRTGFAQTPTLGRDDSRPAAAQRADQVRDFARDGLTSRRAAKPRLAVA